MNTDKNQLDSKKLRVFIRSLSLVDHLMLLDVILELEDIHAVEERILNKVDEISI